MPFANSVNSSNNDFELSSGVLQFANRVRLRSRAGVENIGITQSSGTTFTVQGANAALGSTNPGYVTLQSKATPGTLVKYTLTANQSCTATDIGASTFGITNGVAFGNDFPFFVYAVGNAAAGASPETILKFFLSRYPNTTVSPAAAKIGKAGSIVANSQGSFFALDSSITVADYAGSPCICIGSLRAQRSSGNAITFTTMDAGDGVGNFQLDRKFLLPVGQFGAAAGKYFADNGGTAPGFTSNSTGYWVGQDNFMRICTSHSNASTAGVGGVLLEFAAPYIIDGSSVGCSFAATSNGALFLSAPSILVAATTSPLIKFPAIANGLSASNCLNNGFATAGDFININAHAFIQFT